MSDLKIHTGKYAGRYVSDICKDRKYMNWVMTTWEPTTPIPKAIAAYLERQKELIKQRYETCDSKEFVKEWLMASYEGYKVKDTDLEWVQKLIGTTRTDITVGFLRNEYVFKVGGEEYALKEMVVNERKDVFAAYRHDIQDQIKEFRVRSFHNKLTHKCPETGLTLKNNYDTHTDHHFRKKTFVDLVKEFNAKYDVDFGTVEIENCGMFYRLKDRSLAEKWQAYHRENAILRLIHVTANTNADFYLKKFSEPPFEEKVKVKKVKQEVEQVRILTFDELVKTA